eukprot:TRINITY_DN63508_c0_g2_i1.p1 TRINITY_DN63508_c0_g2~~TRINITY_DN63508_c0_g2_i1.p1  ORF type:complete len:188 (-),score=10.65 TRINITY_DN63508_c0_g2_i1:148-648(-)
MRRALSWFRMQNKAGAVCKVGADKGYGPVIVSANKIRFELMHDAQSGMYTPVSVQDYMSSLVTIVDWAKAAFDRAHFKGFINTKTKDFLLSGVNAIDFTVVKSQNVEKILCCLGKVRYLIKLHKHDLSTRRIEVDLRSPLQPVSSWIANILSLIARQCSSVIVDSK